MLESVGEFLSHFYHLLILLDYCVENNPEEQEQEHRDPTL